ncbi:MAG: PAS domain S-box protein, partial [Desulfobaccales bacterium]
MYNWFMGQMDYIFFFCGLAFIGLGIVCYFLSNQVNQRLPWVWLAFFGITHGLKDWLDLVAITWSDGVWFAACRWAMMTASFLFLVEFGRLSLIRRQGRGPGRWILVILALGAGLGALSGWSGMNAAARYALGLVGGLGAGWALIAEGGQAAPRSRPWLLAGGVGLLLYALAAGLIVPRTGFLPAAAVNYETFANLTGLPIQLVWGVLAAWTAAMSVGYFQVSCPAANERARGSRARYMYGGVTSVVFIIVAGWFFTQYLGNVAQEKVRKDVVSKGNLIIQRLTFELEEAEAAVKAMSGSPWISPALWSRSPQTLAQANAVLDRYETRFEASPAYILDLTGTCIASSNRGAPDSFVGHNYSFRPYFQQAIAGHPGRYFALGIVSKKRGFFASFPVRDPEGKVVGIAAIKTTLNEFQQELQESDPALLISPDGVIFLGTRPSLEYHSLFPVNRTDRQGLIAQYGIANFESVFPQPPKDGAKVKIDGRNYLFYRQAINGLATPGWSLVLLAPVNQVIFYRFLGIVTAFIVVVLTMISIGSNMYIQEGANRILVSEARFRGMFMAAPEAVFVYDPQTRKILDANPFMTQWLGYEPEELVGQEIDQVQAPDSLGAQGECALEGIAGPHRSAGLRYRKKDGSLVEVECTEANILDGDRLREIIFVRDVTERKRAEESIKESLRLRQQILDTIPSPIFYKGIDGRYQGVNQAFLQFYGKTIGHILGKTVHEVFSKDLADKYFQADQDLFQHPGTQVFEFETYDVQGRRREIVSHKATFVAESGALAGLAGIIFDITDQKKAEAERLRFSKLESLGLLAGGIAHDFNNILTAILGNIGLVMLDSKVEPQVQDRLAHAEQACLQAQALSRQLLTFAKGGAPIKKIVSIANLLKESAMLTLSGSRSRYEVSIPDDLWPVEADAAQINQVIGNLLINADQAMPEGGIIKITAENISLKAKSNLPLENGKYIKLTIADQGIGISPKYLNQIFDPYFSTKQKGSGLGLATGYSIIKNHSGHIQVESQLGVGATFHIYLPATDKGVPAADPETAKPAMGHGKVLVMDDEEMVREVLGGMLSRLGYQADFACDGSQAIEKFVKAQEAQQGFDAVILDLTIPGGMGGKEAIQGLLKIDPQVKAIVSSG